MRLLDEKYYLSIQQPAVKSFCLYILAVFGLCLSAQIKIPLFFTPVPVTGQTLAVALIALNMPRQIASMAFLSYLAMGVIGLPVFAKISPTVMGPSFGYLIGMLLSVYIVSGLRQKLSSPSLAKLLSLCYLGSLLTFSVGCLGLSLFVPKEAVFSLGVLPFLAGDLIKNMIAASISLKLSEKTN